MKTIEYAIILNKKQYNLYTINYAVGLKSQDICQQTDSLKYRFAITNKISFEMVVVQGQFFNNILLILTKIYICKRQAAGEN